MSDVDVFAAAHAERRQPADLADILERVLDTGIVIAGEIRIDLLDIELLTIKLRLVVTSVDKAEAIGLDWWRDDPWFSAGAIDHPRRASGRAVEGPDRPAESDASDDAETSDPDADVRMARPVVDVAQDDRFEVVPDGSSED